MGADKAIKRLFEGDASLWTNDPAGQEEIRRRLSWLRLPTSSLSLSDELESFAKEVLNAGFTYALLLGMGGSSLASEVIRTIFGNKKDGTHNIPGLDFAILDSTDPRQVKAAARRSAIERTLYIVSSKSGSTSEIKAFLDYFWSRGHRKLKDRTGDHFIALTDPGTSLEKLAHERQFRRVFTADPNVGGRYSALTVFGLLPAALVGVDIRRLLVSAEVVARQCADSLPVGRNPGTVFGTVIGQAALDGRDKLTFIADREISALGAWLEQLVAESSGKGGRGIVPVDGEPIVSPRSYKDDRLFVYLRWSGKYDEKAVQLRKAGHPVIVLGMNDQYDLGGEFYRWEMGTAIACAVLGVNGFDQPDVQDSKIRSQQKILAYQQTGSLGEEKAIWEGDGARVYGLSGTRIERSQSLPELVKRFLISAKPGDYVALNAYIPRNIYNLARLTALRTKIRRLTGLATTVGFGPRFLHSTGQLHKGGVNNGIFIQITSDAEHDLIIPGQGLTFGTMERAQSLGDIAALAARARRVLRIHLVNKKPDEIL